MSSREGRRWAREVSRPRPVGANPPLGPTHRTCTTSYIQCVSTGSRTLDKISLTLVCLRRSGRVPRRTRRALVAPGVGKRPTTSLRPLCDLRTGFSTKTVSSLHTLPGSSSKDPLYPCSSERAFLGSWYLYVSTPTDNVLSGTPSLLQSLSGRVGLVTSAVPYSGDVPERPRVVAPSRHPSPGPLTNTSFLEVLRVPPGSFPSCPPVPL